MLVLGINDTHDASACLIKDGRLIAVMCEERLQRIKQISSFPHFTIRHIFKKFGFKYSDIDHVAVANKNIIHLNLWNIAADFTVSDWNKLHLNYYYPRIYQNKKIILKKLFPNYKPNGNLGYPIKKIPFISSSEASEKQLTELKNLRLNHICNFLNISENKIGFYDHHMCHAYYAYYLNSKKNERSAIVTSDAGGDSTYNTVGIMDSGKYTLLSKARNNLIGKIYDTTTLILGMNPVRHQYKIMGLAPYVSEFHKKKPREIFLNSLTVNGLEFKKNNDVKDHFFYFKKKLDQFRFDGIAGGLQDFVEIRLVEWFKNISSKANINNFVFSGGVANNVKANMLITKQNFVKNFFVPPAPGDESLSVGAAYAYIYNSLGYKNTNNYIIPLTNAYWGCDVSKKDHLKFKNKKYIRNKFKTFPDKNLKKTARILSKDGIVLFCYGKMEFGPRALGHRSILANPSKKEMVEKINTAIKKRDFWMPFTPSIIKESFDKYVVNPKKISSDFMTTCFESTKLARKHLIAAMHPYDYTLRPQMVTKKTCKIYYKLIKEFKKITGIGALLNTSLNIHDKPIVYQPTDIFEELLKNDKNNINYIFIEDTLYVRKNIKS